MADPKVKVSKGIIEVNSATVMRSTPDVVWIHLDTKQKYPDLVAISDRESFLGASEQTLHVSDVTLPTTEITVEGIEGDWKLFAETGRYYLNMVFVRQLDSDGQDALVSQDQEDDMPERPMVDVHLRTWVPPLPFPILGSGATVSIPLEPGEYVAGAIGGEARSAFLIARLPGAPLPPLPLPVSPPVYGRLATLLPYLDAGERISRDTWGSLFLVVETAPDGGRRVVAWEPMPESRRADQPNNGWWKRMLSAIELDSEDILADDWYVVSADRYQQWCQDVAEPSVRAEE